MKIHIITIFTESFESYFSTSILKKAILNKDLEINFYKLNDFSTLPTKRVDEKAFWMHWQVISPEPLKKAIDFVLNKIWKKVKIVYLTPSGELLTQQKVENYYKELSTEFIIICGHYEWIDQRIIDKYVDYSISIWEYVISSGELSSMVFIDTLVRHIPGVLWNQLSLEEDSFWAKLNRQKEYPVYTKPRVFEGLEVPEVLFSWNHKEISAWKSKNLR